MKKALLLSTVCLLTCLLAACSRPEAGKSKALNPITADPGAVVATRNVDYELPETQAAPEGYISSYDTGDSSGGRSVQPGYYVGVNEVAQSLPVTAQHDKDHGAPHGEDATPEHSDETEDHADSEGTHSDEETAEDHGESEEAPAQVAESEAASESAEDEGVVETVSEAAAGAAAAVAGTLQDSVDAASNLLEDAADVAEDAGDVVAEGVEATREAVAEGVETAGEAVEDASEAVAEVLEPAAETPTEETAEVEASTQETEEQAPEEAQTSESEAPAPEEAPEEASNDEAAGAEAAAASTFDWQALGEQTYNANCVSCHQATGAGIPGAFPPLAGHIPDLYNAEGGREYIINVVLYGLQGEINVDGAVYNGIMTPWSQLSDEEIAATLNHELNSWGNDALVTDFTPILPEEVTALRGQGLAPADVLSLRPAVAE